MNTIPNATASSAPSRRSQLLPPPPAPPRLDGAEIRWWYPLLCIVLVRGDEQEGLWLARWLACWLAAAGHYTTALPPSDRPPGHLWLLSNMVI